jgi:hypothetical protein
VYSLVRGSAIAVGGIKLVYVEEVSVAADFTGPGPDKHCLQSSSTMSP